MQRLKKDSFTTEVCTFLPGSGKEMLRGKINDYNQ